MRLARFLLPAIAAAAPGLASAAVELLETPALHSDSATSSVMIDLAPVGDGYLVSGERGILLQWQPSGRWQQLDSPVSVALTALATRPSGAAANTATAFAVGHDAAILRRDSGGDWQKIFDGYDLTRMQIAVLEEKRDKLQNVVDNPPQGADTYELEYQLEDIQFSLEDARAELENGPNRPLLDIAAVGDDLFAVGAYGAFLQSTDGGDSWKLISERLQNPSRFHLNAIAESGDGSLFIVGENGLGFVSRDGGEAWTRMDLPYDGSLFGIAANKGGDKLITFGLQGNVLISRDAGENWAHHHLDAGASMLGGTITDSGDVYLVGHGGLVARFPIDDPGAIAQGKHPSGAALSAVALEGEQLILAGQFGVTAWKAAWDKKEVAGDAE